MIILNNFLSSLYHLTLEMAPYLLFGFLVAGLLKLFLPKEILYKHLTKRSFGSVFKAALLGVPLPICSCGVIPVAAHLKKEGARNGPILSFLTSTPTSGVDSIMATYSLMGGVFALWRTISSLLLGIVSGTLSNLTDSDSTAHTLKNIEENCVICPAKGSHKHTLLEKGKYILNYAFIELIADVAKWLLIGIIAGALISAVIPKEFVANYLNHPGITYTLMLILGVPLYVCATGSIPLAASFMGLGISPGAALIFLLVGPATNTATISFVAGEMGKKSLTIYLTSIIVLSLIIGIIFDYMIGSGYQTGGLLNPSMEMLPMWISQTSAVMLVLLVGWSYARKIKLPKHINGATIKVSNMSCMSCVGKIEKELKSHESITAFDINLKSKTVSIESKLSRDDLEAILVNSGFTPQR